MRESLRGVWGDCGGECEAECVLYSKVSIGFYNSDNICEIMRESEYSILASGSRLVRKT